MNIIRKAMRFDWKLYLIPYLLLRVPALCFYILNNDEIVPFRYINNFKTYILSDVRLPFYDYLFVKIYTFFFGTTLFPLRIINLIIGSIALFYIYILFSYIKGKKVAHFVCLLYTLSPVFVFYNVYTESYNLSILCLIACVYYTQKKLSNDINKKEKLFFLLFNFILVFTHYLNIVFLGIYYFLNLLRNKKIFSVFIIFLLLSIIPLGLRFNNVFLAHNSYGNSELLNPNLKATSLYPFNNPVSIFFYLFTGLKIASNLWLLLFMIFVVIITLIYSFKEKDTKINTLILSSYIYFLIISLLTINLDRRLLSSSFSQDYLSIVALYIMFPFFHFISKTKKILMISFILLFLISDFFICKNSIILNKGFSSIKKYFDSISPVFVLSEDFTSESTSKEFVQLLFPNADYKYLNKNFDTVKGKYVIIVNYPENMLDFIDDKILLQKNKRLKNLHDQFYEIRAFVKDKVLLKEVKLGGDYFLIYEKK